MAILPIDSGRYGTPEMMKIFSEQNKVDYQLQIEGAAAISQSEVGLIPVTAEKKYFMQPNLVKLLQKESNNSKQKVIMILQP